MVKVEKIVKKPIQIVKSAGKEAIKADTGSNTVQIAVGVIASPFVAYGYNKLFNWISTFFPNVPNWLLSAIKILFPLVPVYPIKRFKIPFGAVVNGALIGIFITQLGMTIFQAITGKEVLGTMTKKEADIAVHDTEAELTLWGVF